MIGKLNGVMPTQTPSGTRSAALSRPTPPSSSVRQNELDTAICGSDRPIMSVGAAHANSTQSMPRRTSPRASAQRLAVLLNDERGELVEVLFEKLLVPEEVLAALADRHRRPLGEGLVRRLHCRLGALDRVHRNDAEALAVGGVDVLAELAGSGLGDPLPRDEVLDGNGSHRRFLLPSE